ncbi:DUF4340 domain-containing protein [Aliikangiella maris]|uniref:DUF4340 domain-containing protein n=2 Tax=Aliikangiella maris TaxID=3162458 RepID=A0ABV3MSK7_9GAMM
MKQLKSKLSILLVLQLVLIGGLLLINQNSSEQHPQQSLMKFVINDVNKIIIDGEDKTISLQKVDQQWQLPELKNLPAESNKITQALNKLSELKTGWPTTTTASAHQRFAVADDKYQRRIQLFKGDNIVDEIYLGTSPGFRKVHVRKPSDSEVYSVKLNTFDFPVNNNDWLEKSLLNSQSVSKIKGNDFELVKSGEDWQLADSQTENLMLDAEKASTLAQSLANLNVIALADSTPASQAVTLEVTDEKVTHQYQFYQQESDYFVARNDIEGYFKISQSDFDTITQNKLENLLKTPKQTEDSLTDTAPVESEPVKNNESDTPLLTND